MPGVDFSNDPLLQGRLFSYLDTQKSRLGTANFHQLPINAPKCPVMNFQRDGQMQMMVPKGRANYEPNSLGENGEPQGPRECPMTGFSTFAKADTAKQEQGDKLRVRAELFADHYTQARLFWISQTPDEQAHIASSFVFELSKVALSAVPPRMVANLRNVDETLAKRVADGLGIALPKKSKAAREPVDLEKSPALSIHQNMKDTLEGRVVGVLISDGSDGASLKKLKADVEAAGATIFVVSPKVGGATLADGKPMKADGQLMGSPSQLFDAVAVILKEEAAKKLCNEGAAVQWVMDAYGHLKAIGHDAGAKALIDRAGIKPDEGVVKVDALVPAAKRRFWAREKNVRMLA